VEKCIGGRAGPGRHEPAREGTDRGWTGSDCRAAEPSENRVVAARRISIETEVKRMEQLILF